MDDLLENAPMSLMLLFANFPGGRPVSGPDHVFTLADKLITYQ